MLHWLKFDLISVMTFWLSVVSHNAPTFAHFGPTLLLVQILSFSAQTPFVRHWIWFYFKVTWVVNKTLQFLKQFSEFHVGRIKWIKNWFSLTKDLQKSWACLYTWNKQTKLYELPYVWKMGLPMSKNCVIFKIWKILQFRQHDAL